MSDPGSSERSRGNTGQRSTKQYSRFEVTVACLLFWGLWNFAAVLTELINIGPIPLDGGEYFGVYLVLVFSLMSITVLISWAIQDPKKEKARAEVPIRKSNLMQKGYDRIRPWMEKSPYRYMLCMAGFMFFMIQIGRLSWSAVESVYDGPRLELYRTLAMVNAQFGFGIVLSCAVGLIAGLWPEKPRSD